MIPFRPSGHWIVVDRDPDKDMIGSVAISQRDAIKMGRGKIVAIGWGLVSQQTGEVIPVNPNIKVGDIVQWQVPDLSVAPQYRIQRIDCDIEVQGKMYTFVPAGNIVLIEAPVTFDEHKPDIGVSAIA